MKSGFKFLLVLSLAFLFGHASASAQTNLVSNLGPVQISIGNGSGAPDIDMGIKILFLMTMLTPNRLIQRGSGYKRSQR